MLVFVFVQICESGPGMLTGFDIGLLVTIAVRIAAIMATAALLQHPWTAAMDERVRPL